MPNFPELKIDGFEAYLDNQPPKKGLDGFTHLGDYSFKTLTAEEESLQIGSVHHGFNVISRLIRIAAELYPKAHSEDEVSVNGLRGILLNSQETPARLANMPKKINSEVEYHFGLTNDALPGDAEDLYAFEPNTAKGTLFILNDERFSYALGEGRAASRSHTMQAKCPFKNMTTQYFWPQMVNLAAESPRLIFDTIYDSKESDT